MIGIIRRGRVLCAALLASAAVWVAACSDAGTGPEPGPDPGPAPTPNRPPAAVGTIPGQEIILGDTLRLDVAEYFADPDGDRLTYAAVSSEPGVAAAAAEAGGSVVTVRALARGVAAVTVTASDPSGLEAAQSFEVGVPNSGPQGTGALSDIELPLGEEATFDVSSLFTDPDGDVLTYRAESSAAAVAEVEVAGAEVTVRALGRGMATVTVTASDPSGLEAAQSFEVGVPNSGPQGTGALSDIELPLGEEATFDVSSLFADPDGDVLTYGAESSDAAVAEVEVAGAAVTVRALGRGMATVTVTASDPSGLEAAQSFDVTVPNSGPQSTGALSDIELPLGEEATFDVSSLFTDPDGDVLTYGAESSAAAVAEVEVAGAAVTVRALARGVAAVTVTASDPSGLEAAQSFDVTVPNSGPQGTGALSDIELPLGEEATFDVSSLFTDPDGDVLTYRAESSAAAVAEVEVAGAAVTVRALARGVARITVTASDPSGLEAAQSFDVTVPNSGPETRGMPPDLELATGDAVTVDVSPHFTDPDGDALAYRAESSDSAVAAAAPDGSEVTVRSLARGTATITVTASDPDGLEASLDFEVTVVNGAPGGDTPIPDLEVGTGGVTTVEASSHFTDPDGDALTYRAASSDPSVAAADASGSVVTVRALSRGTATVTVTASDPDGLEAALEFDVTVVNDAPRGETPIPDIELGRGGETTVNASSHFTDPDGDVLTWSASSSAPAIAAVDVSGSVLMVRALARGSATVTVTASDPDGLAASLAFDVTVPNSPPRGTSPIADIELAPGSETTVDASSHFTDPDGDPLTYSAVSSDATVATAAASGSVVTVRALSRGAATITVTARDPSGLAAALAFEVTVANRAPEGTTPLPDIELARGGEVTLDVSPHFTDPDGDALTYRVRASNATAAAASVSGSTVTIRALRRGRVTITVTARDAGGLEAALSFVVAVPNGAPEGTGPMPDIELLLNRRTTVDASPYFRDPDGDGLTYRASSSDPDVATATASGNEVRLASQSRGATTITVTARDYAGLEASLSFEVTVPNRPPAITATLPDLNLEEGEERTVVLSRFFSDPDGDKLTFSATSSDETRASVTSSTDMVRIKGRSEGTARITARATDALGLSTAQAFDVTVRTFVAPAGFDIDLRFTSDVSASARNVIRQAVSTLEGVLGNSELSDVRFNRQVSCGGLTTNEVVGTVDDLLILFDAESIDGPRGTLGYAGPCTVRESNGLPVVGRVVLDSEDMDRIPATTGLLDIVIHEIAHVLGFGTLWERFGLLADPSYVTPGADTHFTGAGAIAAFNAASGASYTGAKVPVANREPGPDSHWRASIFPGEVMRPSLSSSRRESLSAITIESLADLGYTVNAALADPYGVSPDLPPGRPAQAEAGRILHLGDDILRVPIRVVDDEGRLMRVIPPR
ncbi:Ig-like domain-containing protein [Candidatus Palauibacter sp.]|uniref:Ig-like domain-containing protein n=1 Tax=Candidatus Palauibacter sp. TaxID=3101350 RepID=UPI003B52AF72